MYLCHNNVDLINFKYNVPISININEMKEIFFKRNPRGSDNVDIKIYNLQVRH